MLNSLIYCEGTLFLFLCVGGSRIPQGMYLGRISLPLSPLYIEPIEVNILISVSVCRRFDVTIRNARRKNLATATSTV